MEETTTYSSAAITDRGLSEKRPENEDSYLEIASSGIFAVADGVGGAQAGDVASQMAVEILGEAFVNKSGAADAEDVMREAVNQANAAIYQMAKEIPQLSSMATTLVALHLNGNVATIGHVGDSRLYRYVPGKSVVQETADHSVVAEEVRAGRMTSAQAAHHPAKNVISRALGAEPTVDIDLKTIMFEQGTTFLLCSDGVTRHIDDWELESMLASGDDAAAICERIKKICYERGAEDNLTAVIVRSEPVAADIEADAILELPDEDERTQAAARSPFDNFAEPIVNTAPLVAGNGHRNDPEPSAETASPDISLTTSDPGNDHPEFAEPIPSVVPPSRVTQTIPTVNDAKRSSGTLFTLGAMLLGLLLGAGGMYYWSLSNPQIQRVEVPVLQEKSTNVPLTAFEESRREVDRDPVRFIVANEANPQDATDFYLLGRAHLLTGKYWESKQALQKARERLSTADPSDAKTLSAEISMALAIINSGPAQENFARDVAAFAAQTAAPSANANTAAPAAPAPNF